MKQHTARGIPLLRTEGHNWLCHVQRDGPEGVSGPSASEGAAREIILS